MNELEGKEKASKALSRRAYRTQEFFTRGAWSMSTGQPGNSGKRRAAKADGATEYGNYNSAGRNSKGVGRNAHVVKLVDPKSKVRKAPVELFIAK